MVKTKLERSSLLPVLFRKSEFGAYAAPFIIGSILLVGLAVILYIYTGPWFFKYYILLSLIVGSSKFLYSGFRLLKRTDMFLIADSTKPLNYSVDITNKSKKEQADFENYYNQWMGNTANRTFNVSPSMGFGRYGKLYFQNRHLNQIIISETKYPEITEYSDKNLSEILAHRKLFAPFLKRIYIKSAINFGLTAAMVIFLHGWYKLISILPLFFTLLTLQNAFRRFRYFHYILIREKKGVIATAIDVSNWSDEEREDFESYYKQWLKES